ncbi:MAG: DUF2510 domain-containing protein [Actinobacteria bacterium]|nr:DUF2510 domain-containing protein [Actinomycetota bacterium]
MSQEWSLTPQPAQPAKLRGKGLIISGIVLLVLGLILFIASIVGFGRGIGSLAQSFDSFARPATAPEPVVVNLEGGGTYQVYELASSSSFTSIGPSDITILGPDATEVPVSEPSFPDQTINDGGSGGSSSAFTAVAQFDAVRSGNYTVTVSVDGTVFAVGPGFGQLAGLGVAGILLLVSFLVGVVGLILLIVGLVQRSKSKRALAYGGAGGYAYGAGALPQQYGQQQSYPQQYGQQPAASPYEQPGQPAQFGQPAATPYEQPAQYGQPSQPAAAPQQLPPAGWYPDPSRPGGQRYWDGSQWTEHQA